MATTDLSLDIEPPDQAYRGLPGTGKTTTLLDVLERELDSGIGLDEVAVSTYRVLMAEEFVQRAKEVVGSDPEDHDIRTTHSICYRLLDLESEQVVDADKRAEFCDDFGVDFNPAVARPGTSRSVPLGNELFSALDYARETLQDPTEAYRECPTLSLDARQSIGRSGGSIVRTFRDEYEAWKKRHGFYDFSDMLAEVADRGLTPNVTVLIEDEFQDKSPLQIRVYNTWAADTDRVYVAGDAYQSIYSFMGTSPRYMERAFDVARRTSTLEQSYRFGEDCWAYATGILKRAGYSVPEIEPVGETDVTAIEASEYPRKAAAVNDESAFHLVRANYQKREIADALTDAGVLFVSDGGQGWTLAMKQTYNGFARLRQQLASDGNIDYNRIPPVEQTELARALPASMLSSRRDHVVHEVVQAGAPISRFFEPEEAGPLLTRNPMRLISPERFDHPEQRELLADTWTRRDGAVIEKIPHNLTTIHGSKGQEATHVFLHDLTTPNTDPPAADQAEARVYFVGATRAESHLWIVRHGTMNAAGLPLTGDTP